MCIRAFVVWEPKHTISHKTNTQTNSREQKKPLQLWFVYLRIRLQAKKITA
jgi:hypothetical protein